MQRQCFDHDWQFHLGNASAGHWREPEDSAWRHVDLPHDWSIELERGPEEPSGASNGFFQMGCGWYRKTFNAPEDWRGRKVFVEFEGVYMNAEVWLNQQFLGRHPYGYTTFCYDLTPYLKQGEENVLSVSVDNAAQLNSRWYSGSGIYRHVWLMVAELVHVAHWGVYVTTPEVSAEAATVRVRTTVENAGEATQEVTVRTHLVAPDNSLVATAEAVALAVGAGETQEVVQDLQAARPQLWTQATPALYHLETEVLAEGRTLDTATTLFGIRRIEFDAHRGFLLNGEPVLLKGGCVHHDNGVLGAAAFDRSEERKVELLKAAGYNAIRCAHNPPSPAFLEACDRLGMLVIDEAFDCWRIGKNPYDYHVSFDDWWRRDLQSMILRDRNHPSVIMWSIGNEVGERNGRSGGVDIARRLAGEVRALDPTRPITAAVNGGGPGWPWSDTDDVFAVLDICGYNYQERQYAVDTQRHPERIIYGSESTAGEAFEHWMSVLEMPNVIGDFAWTALDYLGESGIGRVVFEDKPGEFLGKYPWHQANCGDLDLCGFRRPQSYYRSVLWGDIELYIAVHDPVPQCKTPKTTYWGWPEVWPNWTWPGCEGQVFRVDVYSRCEWVELFLNGRSLGVKPSTREERLIATFEVPYEPGVLSAVGYSGDEKVVECEVKTVGAVAGIRLAPDRSVLKAGERDLCFVTVEVVDASGQVDPNAVTPIFFTTQGEGFLTAVGNGNPMSTEPYRGNRRQAYRGRCLVVVQSNGRPGKIRLRAQADGLDGAEATICVK